MILFELFETENHPAYQELEIANGDRQYDFLRSIVFSAVQTNKLHLSQQVIRALNFHAIACLHTYAGEYRPCEVEVGSHRPPAFFRVQALMDDFTNTINRHWDTTDAVVLATYVLWRLNFIHPFENGNGRTARAACYFVLCLKSGGWLDGTPILPALLKQNRVELVSALAAVDAAYRSGQLDLMPLHQLVSRLLSQQLGVSSSSSSNEP